MAETTDIEDIQLFEDLHLGDLVNFITKDYLDVLSEIKLEAGKSTHIIKHGRKDHLPPTMVVVELSRLNPRTSKLYDETTGLKIKDEIQVKCMWYTRIKGKEGFEERWFNRNVLLKISLDPALKKPLFCLNQVVSFRTYLAAEFEITNQLKVKEGSQNSNHPYLNYKFEIGTSSFFPPKMVVTAFGKRNKENKVYSEETGGLIKWMSSCEVKCMWYENASGKFIEKFLPIEALFASETEGDRPRFRIEDYIKKYLDPDSDNDDENLDQSDDISVDTD